MKTALTVAKPICNGGAGIQTYLNDSLTGIFFLTGQNSIKRTECYRRNGNSGVRTRILHLAEGYDFRGHPPAS